MANTVKVNISASDEGFRQTMQQAAGSVTKLGQSMVTSSGKMKTINGALRDAKKQAMELTMQWRELDDAAKNSDFGQSLQQQLQQVLATAGQLQDIKADVANEIKNLASDTAVWDGMSQGIGIVSSSMQSLAGVVGMCGGDVQAFTQALTVMNTVQSVTNTIIGIGNALQKDSALMTMLRVVRTNLLATSEAKAATAIVAETGATEAQTVAQLANNAAVLANPYVLAAAAVVALTAVIVAWVAATDEATQAEVEAQAATELLNQEMDNAGKTVGEQIDAYYKLKKAYEDADGSLELIKKNVIDNTKLQEKARTKIKNHDQAMRTFSTEGTEIFLAGCEARAMGLASEAAVAAGYIKILDELNTMLNKIGSGEEVNIADLEKLLAELGIAKEEAKNIVFRAGYEEKSHWFSRNDLVLKEGENAADAQGKVVAEVIDFYTQHTASNIRKQAQDALDRAKKKARETGKNYFEGVDAVFESPDVETEAEKKSAGAHKRAQNNHKQTQQQQKKTDDLTKKNIDSLKQLMNTLDGCNSVISEADNRIKKLDKRQADYNERLEELKTLKLLANIKKLEFIDQSTLAGLQDYKKSLQQIIELIPDGSELLDDLNNKVKTTNTRIEELYKQRIDSGQLKDLEDLKKYYEDLIPTLRHLSSEETDALRKLKGVEDQIKQINREQENAKLGISTNSVTYYQQQFDDAKRAYENFLANEDLNVVLQIGAEFDDNGELRETMREQLYDAMVETAGNLGQARAYQKMVEGGTLAINSDSNAKKFNVGTLFDYKKSPLELVNRDIDELLEKIEKLEQIKQTDVAPEDFDKAQKDLGDYLKQLKVLQKQAAFTELREDMKQYNKDLVDNVIDVSHSAVDGIKSIYSSVESLIDKFDEAENPIEQVFAVFDTIFTIVDAVKSFIDAVQTITTTLEALGIITTTMQSQQIAKNVEQATTLGEVAAAETTKAAADAAALEPTIAMTAANKAAAAATEELAAAQIFSAHAYIPFAGPGIAAGLVALMEGTLRTVGALSAFAEGGIVGGSTTMGDSVLVRANRGEMILNATQQARLFDMIDHGNIGGVNGTTVTSVRVQGSDIILALRNYSKINHNKQLTNILK